MKITGSVKLGKSTKRLISQLLPGDIAVIDHADIDRVAAEALASAGVKAVINTTASATGAFPNSAPQMLLQANIALIDNVGAEIFDKLQDGDVISIEEGRIYRDGDLICRGQCVTQSSVDEQLEQSDECMRENIESFVANTAEYLKREKGRVLFESGVPEIDTQIDGKQVLVVVRGPDYKEDLKTLRSYISEVKPVIIAVDGGADAVLEAGQVPNIIVGDMDSVSDSTLRCGAELIAHAYEDGRCPSVERLEQMELEFKQWPLAATSEDLAMLLAWENNADLIVAVGTHSNLIEYMEKGRGGMASTFLVRLRVGPKLVDAKGVSKLYRPSPPEKYVLAVVAAALLVIVVVILISAPLRNTLMVMWLSLITNLGL